MTKQTQSVSPRDSSTGDEIELDGEAEAMDAFHHPVRAPRGGALHA